MIIDLTTLTPASLTKAIQEVDTGQKRIFKDNVFSFNPALNLHPTAAVAVQSLNSPVGVSVYRLPGEGAVPVNLSTGSLVPYLPAKIRISKVLTEATQSAMMPGLSSFGGSDHGQNSLEVYAAELKNLKNRVEHTFETMAIEAIQTGIVTQNVEAGPAVVLDFGFIPGIGVDATIQPALAGGNEWDEVTGNPLNDIERLRNQIANDTSWGGNVNVIMGSAAWSSFTGNDRAMRALDNRSAVDNTLSLLGPNYKGTIGGGVSLWVCGYAGWDPDTIAVVPAGSEYFTREHAAVFDVAELGAQSTWLRTEIYAKTFQQDDPSVNVIIVESRPIPVIKNGAALRVLTVQ